MEENIISISTINRLILKESKNRQAQSASAFARAQANHQKELPIEYFLNKVDFNFETRIAKLEFTQQQKYRTITKYITKNYVKYPVYSDWKVKSKLIKKTIKLSNAELEQLNSNEDFLISDFSSEIIIALNDKTLFPFWFVNHFINLEYDEKISEIEKEKENYLYNKNNDIFAYEDKNKRLFKNKEVYQSFLAKPKKKREKLIKKIQKMNNLTPSIIKNIFSFSIYSYLISAKRKNKLLQKKLSIENQISFLLKSIESYQVAINQNCNIIKDIENDIEVYLKKIDELKKNELSIYQNKLSKIEHLPIAYDNTINEGFIPLKTFIGFENKKIIGCYVIHNKETDKYYVGQSKDVYRRLKQHFNGTTPANIIFAEDYYLSNFKNKENLFEVKIIYCETKDELDRLEKQLIELYDSNKNGYNSTNGNT